MASGLLNNHPIACWYDIPALNGWPTMLHMYLGPKPFLSIDSGVLKYMVQSGLGAFDSILDAASWITKREADCGVQLHEGDRNFGFGPPYKDREGKTD